MKRRIAILLLMTTPLAPLLASLSACDGQALNVGGDASSGPTGDANAPTRWIGYLENYQLPSGSDHLTITFASDTTGTIFFGDPPPLSPATDAEAAYPPGATPATIRRGWPQEHFEYTMLSGARAGERFTFELVPDELWRGWCGLQTPQAVINYAPDGGDGGLVGYGCLPNASTTGDNGVCSWGDPDGGQHPVDCVKMALCAPLGPGPCDCVASGCDMNLDGGGAPHNRMRFDLTRTADALDGTLASVGGTSAVIPVHLKRAP